LGTVVKYSGTATKGTWWEFGHVTGFRRNSSDELTLVVAGDDGEIHEIHPENVKIDFDGVVR
jgi:hypothetical protein